MSNKETSTENEKSVDIIELMIQIWRDKFYILIIVIIFFIISIWQLQNSTFKYDVTLKVSPSKQLSSSQNVSTNLGGIASMIGISTQNNDGSDYYAKYKILLKSRIMSDALSQDKEFIESYSKAENLNVSSVLLKNGYQIVIDKSWRSNVKNILGLPTHTKKLTLEDLVYRKIIGEISISSNLNTNITTINLKSVNPELGIKLLKKVHSIADFTLKERLLNRTDDYISFLNKQLSITTKQDQRLSLISTLAEQQRSKMIASSDLSFAAEFFGKPYQSNSPTTPRIRNVVFAFLAIGFFSGLLFSIIKYFIKISKF